MNQCSNCYNGCASIISDRCVRYTGVDVPELGIQNGDSLSYVEQALATYLTSALDASGIHLDQLQSSLCCIIKENLPALSVTTGITALDLFTALIGAVCTLSEQVTCLQKNSLEYSYQLGCLTIDQTSSTPQVLQAVITLLCSVNSQLTALALNVSTNYVPLSQLNSLIAAYLASQNTSSLVSNKMVPYVVYPYLGSLSGKFDTTGAGIGNYANIYICNGLNGTSDLRGVTLVGDTTAYSGASYNSKVDPNITGNPTYNAGTYSIIGNNTITLSSSQIPQTTHNHTITDPGHTHTFNVQSSNGGVFDTNDGINNSTYNKTRTDLINTNTTGITLASTSLYGNGTVDGGCSSHNNFQPSVAVYYIIYLP